MVSWYQVAQSLRTPFIIVLAESAWARVFDGNRSSSGNTEPCVHDEREDKCRAEKGATPACDHGITRTPTW